MFFTVNHLSLLLPLIGLTTAYPGDKPSCSSNACLAAVTGKAAVGDDSIRAAHCSKYLLTVVTPPASTVTTTVTADAPTKNDQPDLYARASVTVCPNKIPDYATACDNAGYSSACSCFGITEVKTTTLAPTTTTKTVYVKPTGVCEDKSAVTVTSTIFVGSAKPTDKCLSDADATGIVNRFIKLLEYTSYNGSLAAPGRGYQFDTSAATLAPDFVDISDSINFMAGFPIGAVTFPNKTAFDYGQGILQPEVAVKTLNIFHGCKDIFWRWSITAFPGALPVTGMNYMDINDKGLIQKNYAEFNSGAWLQNYHQNCALSPPAPPVPAAMK